VPGGLRVRTALAAVLVSSLAGGCLPAGPDSAELDDEALEPVVWTPPAGTSLRYHSRWDWEDATIGPAGEWVFETDLGYRVGIELGVLATISVMLVPCSEEQLAEAGLRAHSTVVDSSELLGPWIEAFSSGTTIDLGSADASGSSYCSLHWLVAALTTSTDEGLELDHTSIDLIGWYESPSGERREFEGKVPLAAGGLPDLVVDPSQSFSEDDVTLEIELLRRPTRALDGEELAELDDAELAYAFVQGLGTSSRAVLVPSD
jgi:hypothetical protein